MYNIHPNSIKALKKANKKKKLSNIKCNICSKIFHPQNKRIKYCSQKCCGKSKKGNIPWNKGLKGYKSGEQHHWYGRNMSGKNNPVWKGGKEFRKESEKKHLCSKYKSWMLSVKERDNWKCKISNKDCKGRLESHHILSWKDFPELRYEINNGITLCHAHHPRARVEEKRLAPTFMELVSVSKVLI